MKNIVFVLFFIFEICFADGSSNLEKSSQKECILNKEINNLNSAIYYGDFNKFVKILNQYPNLINCSDIGNLRPLDYALVYYEKTNGDESKPFFEYLVKSGADLNYKIEDALLTPIEYLTIIMSEKYLIEFFNKYKHKININLNYNGFKGTVLTQAHENDYKQLFKLYLENGAIVNDTVLINITYKILEPFYTKTKYFSLKNNKAINEQLEFFKSKEYSGIYSNQLYFLELSLKYLKDKNETTDEILNKLLAFANLMNDKKLINILTKD